MNGTMLAIELHPKCLPPGRELRVIGVYFMDLHVKYLWEHGAGEQRGPWPQPRPANHPPATTPGIEGSPSPPIETSAAAWHAYRG